MVVLGFAKEYEKALGQVMAFVRNLLRSILGGRGKRASSLLTFVCPSLEVIKANQVLYCTQCGADLSRPVTIYQRTEKWPKFPDRQHVYEEGEAYFSGEPLRKVLMGEYEDPLTHAPLIFMTVRDLLEHVTLTDDEWLLTGCCGPSGVSGPTTLCGN